MAKYRKDFFGGGGQFDTEEQNVSDKVATQGAETTERLVLFQNPASDYLTIQITEFFDGPVELSIGDALGRTTVQRWTGSREQTISIVDLPSGHHLVRTK